MEDLCKMMTGNPDIWYAANIEIADYLGELRRPRFTADGGTVSNPSSRNLWLSLDGKAVRMPAGPQSGCDEPVAKFIWTANPHDDKWCALLVKTL